MLVFQPIVAKIAYGFVQILPSRKSSFYDGFPWWGLGCQRLLSRAGICIPSLQDDVC